MAILSSQLLSSHVYYFSQFVKARFVPVKPIYEDLFFRFCPSSGALCANKELFIADAVGKRVVKISWSLSNGELILWWFQTALAKAVMEIQFYKLGLIPPEGSVPASIRYTFQQLWANNGDIISKQYAGTSALKVAHQTSPTFTYSTPFPSLAPNLSSFPCPISIRKVAFSVFLVNPFPEDERSAA